MSRTKDKSTHSLKYFLSYLSFDTFYAYSFSLCNLNTLLNIIMIPRGYVDFGWLVVLNPSLSGRLPERGRKKRKK